MKITSREKIRVIVIHGAYGQPKSNWFPWLARRVESAGHEALVPRFPTPEGQDPGTWLKAYDQQIDGAVSPSRTVLVAHSLGVAFALRLASRADPTEPYRGVFLAAGFWGALGLPDYDPINAPFFRPLDWEAVRAGCGANARCYAADDDPYVPLPFSREIADKISAPLTIIPGGKHLNHENGMTTFPSLAKDLDALLSTT